MTHELSFTLRRGPAAALFVVLLLGAALLVAVPGALVGGGSARAQAADKQMDIRRLIVANGAKATLEKLSGNMVRGLAPQIRSRFPGIRDDVFSLMLAEVRRQFATQGDRFVTALVPIYDKHFTHAEIRQLMAFWTSPIGGKLRTLQLDLFRETAQAARTWARGLAPAMIDKAAAAMRARGHTLSAARANPQ